ncbi:MAG: cobyrinate a,c-diamide synthase [Lachnospiraceae bacterium]|nr:cobyrinate a,c-diamide synthase [Lachnospiraceae bacterium]
MRRIMLAGTQSGSGKTTITCAVLQKLVNDGYDVSSFKCGPDYIDPMFHGRVIGTRARNLDSCFCDSNTLNTILYKNKGNISVIEGVMGYYDGAGASGSSWEIACQTATPVILIIDCKGMGQSIGAVMKGFLTFRNPSRIAGFIFNRLPESMVPEAERLCEEMQTAYFGRFPYIKEAQLESRHLGLVTAEEIKDIQKKLALLADAAARYLCMDKIVKIAEQAERPAFQMVMPQPVVHGGRVRIGIARDEAFCFWYEDNLELLRELGCEIVPFSPLWDTHMPDGLDGLILPGGYPELYADKLSANKGFRQELLELLKSEIPTIAECGGFLYLQKSLEDKNGIVYDMVGFLESDGYRTDKLQRFGYVSLKALSDNMLCQKGQTLVAHEFHYWDSTDCGAGFMAEKLSRSLQYACVVADDRLYAGFPHLYFYGNRDAACRFVKCCDVYRKKGNSGAAERRE